MLRILLFWSTFAYLKNFNFADKLVLTLRLKFLSGDDASMKGS